MKEYLRYIMKNVTINSLLFLLILSVIAAGIFKDYVNGFVTLVLLPEVQVKAVLSSNEGVEIKTDDVSISTQEKIFGSVKRQIVWQELSSGEYEASFKMIASPTEYIYVPTNSGMTEIRYAVGNNEEVLQRFTETEVNAGFVKIYPFAESYSKVVCQMVIYCVLSAAMFLFALWCHVLLQKGHMFTKILATEYSRERLWFVAVWALLYMIVIIEYKFNIGLPHYIPDNALGDQGGYWATYIFKHGFIDFEHCSKLASFRGYTCYLFSTIARMIGNHTGVDSVVIYLLFPTFFFSWLLTIVLPQLFAYATNKKVVLLQVISSIIIIIYFWNAYLTAVLSDFYSIVSLIAAITYTIAAIRKKKLGNAIVAGLSLGLAINLRVQYYYAVIFIVVVKLTIFIYHKIKKEQIAVFVHTFRGRIRKTYKYIIAICLGFLLISWPQGVINYKAGHIGIIPYDSEYAYANHPTVWAQWNIFLEHGMVLWPRFIGDDQLATMKTQLYSEKAQTLNVPQALDVYANSPIETIVCFVKKMVTGLDIKSNINYPDYINWRNTSGLAFSFVNYLIISIGIYTFARYKKISKDERQMISLFFIGTIVPMMVGHCEWRFFLAAYMIFYFMFSYHFMGEIFINGEQYKQFCNEKYLQFIVFAEIFAFTFSLTLWA